MRELMEDIVKEGGKKGAEFCDVRMVTMTGTSIRIEDGVAKELMAPRDYGACVRVLYNGYWGFASTNIVDKASLEETLFSAIDSARAKTVGERTKIVEVKPHEDKAISKYEIDPREVSEAEKMEHLRGLEEAARQYSDKVANTVLGYGDGVMQEVVCNSFGVYTDQTLVRTRSSIVVTAKEGDNRQSARRSIGKLSGFELIKNTDPEKFGIEAAKVAVDLLKADKAPAGSFPVIMDPGISGLFAHEALGHNAEGDLVAFHESIIEGMVGEKIASEAVTLIDDATYEDYTYSGCYYFDSEGTPAQRRVIIEEGVLKGYMHSLETAALLDAQPNGSCRGYLHQNIPIVRMSNTFFAPGEYTLDELMNGIELGLLVKGANWGYVFVERGQFTCNIEEAYMIRNGKLAERISNVSIGGLTLDTLKRIEGCSKEFDLRLSGGMCGKGQPMWVDAGGPYMLVGDVVVGGYK